MIVGVGIDQVEIERVARVWRRFGPRFAARVYTVREWDYCLSRPNPVPSMAARFAAKEAAMKALGRGWLGGIGFSSIEVTREPSGRPALRFSGAAAKRAAQLGNPFASVSLSHDRTYAAATVILEHR